MKKFLFLLFVAMLLTVAVWVSQPVAARESAGTLQHSIHKSFLFTKAGITGGLSECFPDGIQPSGAVYRICMPPAWHYNNQLVIWAHGYVAFNEPIAIPEDQLCIDGFCIPDITNTLGFGFATTSYRTNGLAIVPGLEDVQELIDIYEQEQGVPERVFIIGASEGGIITTLSLERYQNEFDGGLSMCGPIGDFRHQINYFGDFRVIFDYFFPGIMYGSPVNIPPDLIENWDAYWATTVWPAVADPANFEKVVQLMTVTNAPYNEEDLVQGALGDSVETSVHDGLWYNVFATNDGVEKLGGQPFDNMYRQYSGSNNDVALNLLVNRITADPEALESMIDYQTNGVFSDPMVTLHTLKDQQVPYWHETLYGLKVRNAGTQALRANLPINRYEHCNFTPGEALLGFGLMYMMATNEPLDMNLVRLALPNLADQVQYTQMLESYHK